ncbi:hypothetical protein K9M47_01920 [Candidatus Gracilibacteria bacterium]|nr:hypothetical protein [Candidatus Gracilibacteria bacterium]
MKTNLILNTKIIYFSEKIVSSKYGGDLLTSKEYLNLIGMSEEDTVDILENLKNKGIVKWEFQVKLVEEIDEWVEYDSLKINKRQLKKYIQELKEGLREKPLIRREEIVQIVKQLKIIFGNDKLMKIISSIYSHDEIYRLFNFKKYTLIDLLFYVSYSEEVSVINFLVEFLNPIYYDIKSEIKPQRVFEFIDIAVKSSTEEGDYSVWTDKASKYIKTLKNIDKRGTRKDKIETKISDSIEIASRKLKWNDKKVPLGGGLREMFIKLNDTAEIYREGILIKEGQSVHRNELQKLGNYRSDSSFRTALKVLRSRIEECGIPAEIFPKTQNKYILVIKHINS